MLPVDNKESLANKVAEPQVNRHVRFGEIRRQPLVCFQAGFLNDVGGIYPAPKTTIEPKRHCPVESAALLIEKVDPGGRDIRSKSGQQIIRFRAHRTLKVI